MEHDAEDWQYSLPDNERKLGITGEVISLFIISRTLVSFLYAYDISFFLSNFSSLQVYPFIPTNEIPLEFTLFNKYNTFKESEGNWILTGALLPR